MLETVLAGLGVVASVASMLQQRRAQEEAAEVNRSIEVVEEQVGRVRQELRTWRGGGRGRERVMENYNRLVHLLQQDRYFGQQLEFIPTEYGTWRLVARGARGRTRKSTILRDPQGEFFW